MGTNKGEKNIIFIIYYILTVLAVVIFIAFSARQGFWFDELFNIGVVSHNYSFSDMLHTYVTGEVTNPPLYTIFLYFWYRIMPHGEIYLLFPNAIIWGLGVIILMKTIFRLTKDAAAPAVILVYSVINVFMINNVIWELRNYSLLFFMSALTFSMYIKARQEKGLKDDLILGIFMILLAFSHYFGDLAIVCYAMFDLILLAGKKISIKQFLPYIMCGITMGPFFVIMLLNKEKNLDSFWIGPPGLKNIADTLVTLTGNKYGLIIAGIFIAAAAVYIIKEKIGGKSFLEDDMFRHLIPAFVIFMTMFMVFVYSRFLNPEGSMWLVRYFTVLMPLLYFCIADAFSLILNNKRTFIKAGVIALMALALVFGSLNNFKLLFSGSCEIAPDNVNTRYARDIINEDIKNNDDHIVLTTLGGFSLEGWKEYYWGDRTVNIISEEEQFSIDDRDTLWLFYPHRMPKEETLDRLGDDYEYFEGAKLRKYRGRKKP